jgi:hypothetical protein
VQLTLTYDTFKSFCPAAGKQYQIFFKLNNSNYVESLHCTYYPNIIFILSPSIAKAVFCGYYKEGIEVIDMAGAGTGSVVSSPVANAQTINAQEVNISPANTAQQLPSLAIPDGRAVVIKSEQGNSNNVYVSDSAANVAVATSRFRLRAGDFVTLKVANLDEVWVFSTNNNQKLEIVVEQ